MSANDPKRTWWGQSKTHVDHGPTSKISRVGLSGPLTVLEKPVLWKQGSHCLADRLLIRKAITIRFHSSSSAQLRSWDTRQACRWKTNFGMDCTKLQRARVLRHLHLSSASTPSALFTIFHRPSGFSYWIISEPALIRLRKLPPKPANVWWSCLTRNVSQCCGPFLATMFFVGQDHHWRGKLRQLFVTTCPAFSRSRSLPDALFPQSSSCNTRPNNRSCGRPFPGHRPTRALPSSPALALRRSPGFHPVSAALIASPIEQL